MKTAILFLISMFFSISTISDAPTTKVTTAIDESPPPRECTSDPRLDFILGSWTGTGFVTDANGLQQYVEIRENNSSVSNIEYRISGICKNPASNFTYGYDKTVFYNMALNAWYTKGTINNIILPDSRTILSENEILAYAYSYYTLNNILVRHITTRDTADSFTETQEEMGINGWDTTAWFRMTRVIVK
jgi:hypothetical protein